MPHSEEGEAQNKKDGSEDVPRPTATLEEVLAPMQGTWRSGWDMPMSPTWTL